MQRIIGYARNYNKITGEHAEIKALNEEKIAHNNSQLLEEEVSNHDIESSVIQIIPPKENEEQKMQGIDCLITWGAFFQRWITHIPVTIMYTNKALKGIVSMEKGLVFFKAISNEIPDKLCKGSDNIKDECIEPSSHQLFWVLCFFILINTVFFDLAAKGAAKKMILANKKLKEWHSLTKKSRSPLCTGFYWLAARLFIPFTALLAAGGLSKAMYKFSATGGLNIINELFGALTDMDFSTGAWPTIMAGLTAMYFVQVNGGAFSERIVQPYAEEKTKQLKRQDKCRRTIQNSPANGTRNSNNRQGLFTPKNLIGALNKSANTLTTPLLEQTGEPRINGHLGILSN